MKKELLKGFAMVLMVVALAFVTAVASNGQSSNRPTQKLVADIPFEFSIDYKTMAAGEYIVQTLASASDAVLIQSADGKSSVLRPSEATATGQNKASARLIFHRYGQRYFLKEVWTGAGIAGHQLMKSSDERAIERDLANITSKSEMAQSSYEIVEVMATLR